MPQSESDLEQLLIGKLIGLKYEHRPEITDRAALERNFREKFEALNRVTLTDAEFARLLDQIVTPDVFTAAKILRQINAFERDEGTHLNYSLVDLRDRCKNHFEVVNQLRVNTDNSHTTGRGKTLTSFKASTLLKMNDRLHKCVFVVDGKDLDRQTREEFNRLHEGCVEENTDSAALVHRLLSENYADKVIVTTIQKPGLALDESSKRNRQRKKNALGLTKTPRFAINGASRAIQHYYFIPCAGGWTQTQIK